MDLAPPPTDAAPASAPPDPDAAPPDRVVGGVAALLGDRLGVDALWIRIGFVLLALVGGIGLLVYGALWLSLVYGAGTHRRWARLVGGALLVLGIPLLLHAGGFGLADGPLAVLALLAGLAVALWQPRRTAPPHPAPRLPGALGGDVVDAPERAARRLPAVRRPSRPPRPPSILGRLTLGVALLVVAVGALVDQANGARMHPEQWLGAAAVICGVGLVVGAFAGRARWLVLPAVLFAGAGYLAGESAGLGLHPTEPVGTQYVWLGRGDPGGGSRREHVVIGDVDVNIDAAPATPVTVDARTAIGDVRIRAADDVTVEVRARAGDGDVIVEGAMRSDGTVVIGPDGRPDVVVVARTGRGDIDIAQYPAVPPEAPRPPDAGEAGRLVYITDGVEMTTNGSFALAGGEAVIGPDDDVVIGHVVPVDRVLSIMTGAGEFRLLPDGLLLTPFGELLDLHAVRAGAGIESSAEPADTVPPASTLPTVATTTGG